MTDNTVYRPISSGGYGGDPVAMDEKDGKLVRIRPLHLDERYPTEEMDQRLWEVTARGKTLKQSMKMKPPMYAFAYRKYADNDARVAYPLKRVDWDPNGERNPQNRGKSQFERISWDEAFDIMESEIKRVYETYGPSGVLCIGEDGHRDSKELQGHGGGCHMHLMRALGGYTREVRTPDSVEGYYWGGKHTWGTGALGGLGMVEGFENITTDVSENTETIMLQSGDIETTQNFASQGYSQWLNFWQELGIKIITIDPFCNYTTVARKGVKWVPIRPATDAAFDFALMYVWLTEDLYDKEYVETHTVGFDKLKAYVLGEEDGTPKTPAWAAEITGCPEYTIKAVARRWGRTRTSIGHFCGTHIRVPYSHEPGRTEYYKFAMQGIGKPGVHQIHLLSWITQHQMNNDYEMICWYTPGKGKPIFNAEATLPNPYTIPRTLIAKAIREGEATWWGTPQIASLTGTIPPEEQFIQFHYPNTEAGGGEFHMLWTEKCSNMSSWNGGFEYQEAMRSPKVEFYVANHQWLDGDALFADLVLPVTVCIEERDIVDSVQSMNMSMCYCIQNPTHERVGESKSDFEIALELARRFGVDNRFSAKGDLDEQLKRQYNANQIRDDLSYEEFCEKGYYYPPLYPKMDVGAGMYDFYADPENHPLTTPSGKIEIFSQALEDNFPGDVERGPMAKYVPGGKLEDGYTHDESLVGEKAKTYPLLLNAPPGRWRVHAQNGSIPWLREIPTCKIIGKDGYAYEPVWISPDEAAKRGIAHGDIVKVFNDEGVILAAAYVTERMAPNSVMMAKGATPDPIGPRIDRGGCTNLISPPEVISKHCAGFVVSGYLVDVAKLEDAEYEELKNTYPEAFARAYNPATGSARAGWVKE